MNSPINYLDSAMLNHWSLQPANVKTVNNIEESYQKRYLWNMIFSSLKFNIPDSWKLNYFRLFLFHSGSIAVIYTSEYGWICHPYSVREWDLYYNPLEIEVVDRLFPVSKKGIIGVNSGIIHLLDDFRGLDDLVTHYATKLQLIDVGIEVSLLNSRMAYMVRANSTAEVEEYKETYKKITSGEPCIFTKRMKDNTINSSDVFQIFNRDLKSQFIVPELQAERRAVVSEFCTKIGIPNTNYEKKEKLIKDEVGANDAETTSLINIMIENITKDMEMINNISGLNLSVEYAYKENLTNGTNNIDGLV